MIILDGIKKLLEPNMIEETVKKELKPNVKIWRPKPINTERHFSATELIVSKTDTRGNITYGNEIFAKMAGYTEYEYLGQPHNIIRHPDMPKAVFKLLWDTLATGKEINAYVKNLARDGSYYWVFANVTPSFDRNHNVVGYHSTRRNPNPKALEIVSGLYKKMKGAESYGGVHESTGVLVSVLEAHKLSYEELIYRLQYNTL
jgi:PAS domain S-box-containing protein